MVKSFVVNEIQLSYKYHIKAADMPKVINPEQAYEIFYDTWDHDSLDLFEQSKAMLINRAGRVLGIYHLGNGSVASCPMDPRLVLVAALKANASAIIIAHSHPSGNLRPSDADKKITQRFENACNLLDVNLSDHIIVCRDGYYSFTEQQAYEKISQGEYTSYMPI